VIFFDLEDSRIYNASHAQSLLNVWNGLWLSAVLQREDFIFSDVTCCVLKLSSDRSSNLGSATVRML